MRRLQSHKGNNYFANRDTHPGGTADSGKERWKRAAEKAAEKSGRLLFFPAEFLYLSYYHPPIIERL
jgi:hypothetical protein